MLKGILGCVAAASDTIQRWVVGEPFAATNLTLCMCTGISGGFILKDQDLLSSQCPPTLRFLSKFERIAMSKAIHGLTYVWNWHVTTYQQCLYRTLRAATTSISFKISFQNWSARISDKQKQQQQIFQGSKLRFLRTRKTEITQVIQLRRFHGDRGPQIINNDGFPRREARRLGISWGPGRWLPRHAILIGVPSLLYVAEHSSAGCPVIHCD